jgi:hypothetical protein
MLKAHKLNGDQLSDIPYFKNIIEYPKTIEEYAIYYKQFMRYLDLHLQEYSTSHELEGYMERLVMLPHYDFQDYIRIFESYGFRLNKSTPEELSFVKYYTEKTVSTIKFQPYSRKLSIITNGQSVSDYQELMKDLDSLSSQYYIVERTIHDNSSSK